MLRTLKKEAIAKKQKVDKKTKIKCNVWRDKNDRK